MIAVGGLVSMVAGLAGLGVKALQECVTCRAGRMRAGLGTLSAA